MKSHIIDIYYFSGTGNTQIAVKKLAETLQAQQKTVNLYRIEKAKPKKINPEHTIGLAFPVAAFSTYPFVWHFIQDLPDVNGTEVFMLDTMAQCSGGIIGPLKRTLTKKGFKPIGAKQFIMPSNYSKIAEDEKNQTKIHHAMPNIEHYAMSLIDEKATWKRIPIFSDLLCLLTKMKFPWRLMGKWITIDKNECIQCGQCEKLCPVRAIEMHDYPVKHHKCCCSCMRCLSFCPVNAFRFRGKKKKQYRAVSSDEILS